MKSDFAILILSCDKYSDLWDPFFKQFWKYWPDCPYKVYLGSNETTYKNSKVVNVLSGKDIDWSHSYRNILDQIPENYLFVWLDDVFLISEINSDEFGKCFDYFKKNNGNHMAFLPNKTIKERYYLLEKGMPYRVCVLAFWKKTYLQNILINGENPWNFEIMGSYRASYDEGFFCVNYPLLEYIQLVEKKFWTKKGFEYCKNNNIQINEQSRPIQRFELFNKYKDIYFNLMLKCPWRIRVKIMGIFRKLFISY